MATRTWIGTTSGSWATASNWVEAAVPVNGDAVVIRNNSVDIDTGLNQSAVTLASLTIDSTYTGKIGTSSAYLQVGATVVNIGGASGSSTAGTGSQRIKIDFGSVQMTTTVVSTCTTSADTGLEPFRWIGSHASNKCYCLGGRTGVATTVTSETATLSEFDVSGQSTVLNLGAGCTLTTGIQAAGIANINSAMTTLTMTGGTTTTSGSGAITTINLRGAGAVLNSNSTGTVTTMNLYAGKVDFRGNPAARTVTTLNQYAGTSRQVLGANPTHITITNRNEFAETITLS